MILQLLHLARRFFRSLFPTRLANDERAWVMALLNSGEQRLFSAMSTTDQRHAYRVAQAALPGLTALDLAGADRDAALAAALLHDVGKTASGLGTIGRVGATLSRMVAGEDMGALWQERSGYTRKVGLYLRYGDIGSEMLALAESHAWVIAWSREHHLSSSEWTVPESVGAVLVASDE